MVVVVIIIDIGILATMLVFVNIRLRGDAVLECFCGWGCCDGGVATTVVCNGVDGVVGGGGSLETLLV